jgi:two-component system sensor histidine kinase UhpB
MVWMVRPDQESELAQRMERFAYDICSGANVELDLDLHEINGLTMEQRRNIYLIYKEAVNNAIKYAQATVLKISLKQDIQGISLIVIDNGIGFDTVQNFAGNGLRNMQRRAEELRATLTLTSSPNKGTKLLLKYHPN